jgi:hypothetical protein
LLIDYLKGMGLMQPAVTSQNKGPNNTIKSSKINHLHA